MTRSRTFTTGLVICTVLGTLDVLSVAGAGAEGGPPGFVVVIGLVLGVITLVGATLTWRGRPGGLTAVVVSRVLSALLGFLRSSSKRHRTGRPRSLRSASH